MIRWPRRRAVVETTRVGPYELRVEVRHTGTRSAGRIGRLFRDGREIRGERSGDTVVVDPASPASPAFVYVGGDRPHLWSVSGWTLDPTPAAREGTSGT